MCLLTAPATAHLIVDVAGYFPAAADQPAESEEPPPTTTTVPGEPTTTTTTVPADTTVPGDTTPTTTAPPEAPAACALYLSQATAQVVYDLAVFLGATDFAATLDLDGDGVACEDYAFPL